MKLTEYRDRMAEADLQTRVIDYAHIRGWRVHHDRGDYRTCVGGDPGFPDLVLARRGRVVFAELKTARGRVTQQQTEWVADLNGIAVGVYVWRPADWPVIEEVLK